MAALAVAQVVAAIAGAIKGMSDANATERWQREASGKLDFIIAQNGEILKALRELPLIFEADLEKFFNSEVAIQGKALCTSFDNYMKGRRPDIPQIKSIRTPSDLLLANVTQRGPCIYQSANAMALLVLAIHKLLHVDHKITKGFIDQALKAMLEWASTHDGMFGKALIDTQTALTRYEAALAGEPRGHVVIHEENVEYHDGGGGGHRGPAESPPAAPEGKALIPMGRVHLVITADIAIDDKNLTFSVQNARSSYGPNGLHFDDEVVGQKAGERRGRIQGEINNVGPTRTRLDMLDEHLKALQKMIAALQNWH